MSAAAIAHEVWHELLELRRSAGGDAELDELVLFAGAAIGDAASVAELERCPAPLRRAVVLALSRVQPLGGGLAELAFRVIAEHDVSDVDDLRLGVSAGMTPREAGWEVLSREARARCLTALVRAGTPASAAELVSLAASQIDEADKGALVVAWCAFRAFEHSPDEYRLVAELTPESRLEAMAHVLFRGPINPFVAHTWALDGDASWRLARSESDHALADARMGAIAVAAGARAEGEAMVAHALGLTTRLSDSEQAAAAYAVVLGAAASTGIGPWLAAVETLTNDRRILRSRRAFLVARAAAVRTLARAAAAAAGPPPSGGATVATAPRRDPYVESALDRGQTALKEACRRVPERWLDLLQRTTAAALFSRIEGRSIEVQLAEIVDWLRLEWPAPIAEIALDECLARLALAAPDRVVPIGRQLAVPRSGVVRTHARALWLARAVPCLCADRMVQADSLTQAAAR